MKNEMVTFEDLDLEALTLACQSAFEDVEDVFRVVEKSRTRLEYFGKLLTAAKSKVPHGEWDNWITDTFQGRLKIRTAQLWMAKAQKVALLESGEVPRESRKPGRVQVLEPSAGETTEDTPAEYQDDDPTPDLPTQRKTAAGSKKVKESDKPKTRPVVPEVIEADEPAAPFVTADPWEYMTFGDIVAVAVGKLNDEIQKKKAAKELRNLADKLDPPDESQKIPSAAKLQTVCDLDCDWSDDTELREAIRTWIAQKQRYKKTEWRYQTVESFKKDMKHLRKVIASIGVQAVIKKLDEAERKGWRHWDHDTEQNGKGNNGHSKNGGSRGLTAEDVFSAESLGRGR